MSRQIILSQKVVEAGLWYVLSLRYNEEITEEMRQTPPDKVDYWSHKLKIDSQMKEELLKVLDEEAQVVKDQHKADKERGTEKSSYVYPHLEEIWPRIVLAKKRAQEHPQTTIPAAVYEQLRMKEITSRGVHSSQGMVRWPPTCQTITKRCGGSWNCALESLGLMTSKRGRARGSLKFNDEKYLQASVEFIKHCLEIERATTVSYYCQWVARERRCGRIWPSAAAQRQLRGTWNHVLELGNDLLKNKRSNS